MQNRPDNNFYLIFNAIHNPLAAKVQSVVEVLEKQRITKIPKSPKQIMGVISFRGEIIPVIDPRVILNLPTQQFEDFGIMSNGFTSITLLTSCASTPTVRVSL